ncbi:MAG: hypothetical protein ABIP65_11805, partial [Vicinamibacterales bacterium]
AAAAKALSLASGGSSYFATSIAAVTGNDEAPLVRAAFERAQAIVQEILRENTGPILSGTRVTKLAGAWREMWDAIDASLSAPERERLAHLPIR